ncbi:hypothetical protein MTR_5g075170 [Medicago truncatula]|uniref:Uncharacterized protein n=1 Tax=Medicago truncatula TaxID=3880 RepID=G7K0R7_MEDTR|nr:hypothetical protein MTR_5g075170 [Medicago truncatula]
MAEDLARFGSAKRSYTTNGFGNALSTNSNRTTLGKDLNGRYLFSSWRFSSLNNKASKSFSIKPSLDQNQQEVRKGINCFLEMSVLACLHYWEIEKLMPLMNKVHSYCRG